MTTDNIVVNGNATSSLQVDCPEGITALQSLNGSKTNPGNQFGYRAFGTDEAGSMKTAIYYRDTVSGSFQGLPGTGTQYWDAPSNITPADFYAVPVVGTGVDSDRTLTAVGFCILSNAVGWNIVSGSLEVQIGYVPAGSPVIAANFTQIYTSGVLPTGIVYPLVAAEGNFGTIPGGARVVARLVGSSAVYSSPGADAALTFSFN